MGEVTRGGWILVKDRFED